MRLTFRGTEAVPEYRGWHGGCFVHLKPGDALETSDADAAALLADYPVNFSRAAAPAEDRALDRPPVDRMIRRTRTK